MPPEASEPILPAPDLSRTRAFYESLGFKAGYHDDRYEILRRGNLVVHLEPRDDLVPATNRTSCYWRVADADALYHELAKRFAAVYAIDPDGSLTPIHDWAVLEARLAAGKGWEDLLCMPEPEAAAGTVEE